MNLLSTFAGSMMEGFLPRGWDLAKIDACCSLPASAVGERQAWWHPQFEPVPCNSIADFDVMMGHEIALAIKESRDTGPRAAPDLASRSHGHVPLGRLLPQGMERLVRSCLWLQHGRVERSSRRNSAGRESRGVSATRWSRRSTARSGPAPCRPPTAGSPRPSVCLDYAESHRRARKSRRSLDRHLRHRPGVSHRVLGAPLRR